MKANKAKQNYPKYKKVSTNIKGDLLLDDHFETNQSKDDTEAVSEVFLFIIILLICFFFYGIFLPMIEWLDDWSRTAQSDKLSIFSGIFINSFDVLLHFFLDTTIYFTHRPDSFTTIAGYQTILEFSHMRFCCIYDITKSFTFFLLFSTRSLETRQ